MFVLFGSWSHIFLLFISRRIFSLHYLGVLFLSFHKNTLLDSRAVGCVFMGYGPNKRGCKCYHSSNRTYFVSTDITFHERAFFPLSPASRGATIWNESQFLPLMSHWVTNFLLSLSYLFVSLVLSPFLLCLLFCKDRHLRHYWTNIELLEERKTQPSP